MKKYTRSYYCKKIASAIKASSKGNELNSAIEFYDDLDWDAVNGKGVWTDVLFKIGDSSVFAFTVSSSFSRGGLAGTVPEAIRDFETGLWDMYIHKKYISQKDVGKACRKWVKLQSPINTICMGCNVRFNERRLGHVFTTQQHPRERLNVGYNNENNAYRIRSFSRPISTLKEDDS